MSYLYERELSEISKFHADTLKFKSERINRGDMNDWPRGEKGERGSTTLKDRKVSIIPLKIHTEPYTAMKFWRGWYTWCIFELGQVHTCILIPTREYKWTESDKCIINIGRAIPFEFICNPNLAGDPTSR